MGRFVRAIDKMQRLPLQDSIIILLRQVTNMSCEDISHASREPLLIMSIISILKSAVRACFDCIQYLHGKHSGCHLRGAEPAQKVVQHLAGRVLVRLGPQE